LFIVGSTTEEEAAMRARVPLLMFISCAIVILQWLTLHGCWISTLYPDCVSNDYCQAGRYCMVSSMSANNDRICTFCGSSVPMPLQTDPAGGSLNNALVPGHVGYNLTLAADILLFTPL
jgi:hypothetical protein